MGNTQENQVWNKKLFSPSFGKTRAEKRNDEKFMQYFIHEEESS